MRLPASGGWGVPSGVVVLQHRRTAGVDVDQCATDRGDGGFEPVRDAPVDLEGRAGRLGADRADGRFGVLEGRDRVRVRRAIEHDGSHRVCLHGRAESSAPPWGNPGAIGSLVGPF